jgi:cell division septation protein DedD
LINRICDRALHAAAASRSVLIDAYFVWDAIERLGLSAANGVEDSSGTDRSSQAGSPPSIAAASAPPEAASLAVAIRPAPETASAALTEFTSEADRSPAPPASMRRSAQRSTWAAAAIAFLVAASACLAGLAWFAPAIDAEVMAPPLPSPPALVSQPGMTIPLVTPSLLDAVPSGDALAATPVPRAAAVSGEEGAFTIVVASFESRDRAARLVEELTNAGYRARAVERDGGPSRGRLVQVNVGAYASAIDVQRDLQQIRELPGGYSDARIVARR